MINIKVSLTQNQNFAADLLALAQRMAEEGGELKRTEVGLAEAAAELAGPLTPVSTGSWASAWGVYTTPEVSYVAIAPEAKNILSPEDPWQYGPDVHAMGGFSRSGHERAVLDVLVRDYGDQLIEDAGEQFVVSLEVFG